MLWLASLMMFWCIFLFPRYFTFGNAEDVFWKFPCRRVCLCVGFPWLLGLIFQKDEDKTCHNYHWGIITKNQTRIGHGFAFLISWWSISYSYRCNCHAFFELPKAMSLDGHSQEPEAEIGPHKTLGLWTNRKINQQTCDLLTIIVTIHWQYITIMTIHY